MHTLGLEQGNYGFLLSKVSDASWESSPFKPLLVIRILVIYCHRKKLVKVGVVFCAMWHHLLVTKSNTPPWVFLTFFKFWKWYQIAKMSQIFDLNRYSCAPLFPTGLVITGLSDRLHQFYWTTEDWLRELIASGNCV